MFERITTDSDMITNYHPTILSNPDTFGPWIVVLENVVTPEESQTLIDLGAVIGYELSKDVGKRLFDGTFEASQSERRTSTNAWCYKKCYDHPVTKRVLERIENLTGIPEMNSEYLQLLKYEEGQFYRQHHDYIPHNLQRPQGVRILTVFLYLNDVEAGGGTRFTSLNLTVSAKQGRALLWPNVYNQSPDRKDPRTEHEALPVEKGIKYGANAWIHQRDFKTPYSNDCK